jgi:MYXO-CTERM domain-containing protein
LETFLLLTFSYALLGPIGALGDHHHMNADEIAGLGLGAAALIGAVGYLFLRRRHNS